jgi:hypothetical protein
MIGYQYHLLRLTAINRANNIKTTLMSLNSKPHYHDEQEEKPLAGLLNMP